jgi:hypothetical protein
MYQVVDNALVSVGGGSASLETIFQLLAEEEITDWATGDNATFLGGGTLSGTFVKNTTNPLQGDADYKYTQAAGSLNDYLASPAQDVDPRFRGKEVTLFFPYTYDGANDDIEVIFYDVTNAAIIPSSAYIQAAASVTMFKTNIVIPSTCASIRVGFQVKVLNSTKIFVFDSVQLSSDTTIYADIANISDWEAYTPTLTGFGTATSVEFEWRRVGDSIEIRGKWTSGTSTATEARISLPNSYTSANTIKIPSLKIAGWGGRTSTSSTYFGSISTLIEPSVQYLTLGHGTSSNSPLGKRNGSDLMSSGQSASIFATIPVAGLISSNSNILTAPETFSTDTAPLTYAGSGSYTLSTLANAPVGTYITFTYAINTNTRTQTTTAPTQTTSDMNTNGILLYSRPYNAASTAAQPTAIAIQIGKGLKGVSLNLYKSTGKTTSGTIDSLELSTGTIAYGLDYKDYNESTGILILDAGVNSTAVTNKTFRYSDVTTQTSGYLVINASKNPALTGLNINAVGARYTSTSGQAIGNSATLITYETKVADTHGAYNSGVYTVPETGWYQINASYQTGTSVTISTTASTFIWMYIDGANYKTSFVRGNGASTTYGVHISESVYLRKNQTVSIYGSSSVATTASTGISANAFSIVKTSTGTGN